MDLLVCIRVLHFLLFVLEADLRDGERREVLVDVREARDGKR